MSVERGALVTGASGAIGGAVTRLLVQRGFRVTLGYLSRSESAAELAASSGPACSAHEVDVTDRESVRRLVTAAESWSPIEVLVNCAGAMSSGLMVRQSEEAWWRLIEVNLLGTYNVCRAVVPALLRRRSGLVVNVASVAALKASAGQTSYSASKAAIIGLTRSMAAECAQRNVRVNALAPGLVMSEMTSALSTRARELLVDRIPLGRPGTPEEMAVAVGFLIDCSYVTGQTLAIDGGLSA